MVEKLKTSKRSRYLVLSAIITIFVVSFTAGTVIIIKELIDWTLSTKWNLSTGWPGFFVALMLWGWLMYRFIHGSLRYIESNPPHKGILVFFGKRIKIVLSEGLHFLPLYPIAFDVVLVKMEKNNKDLLEQIVKTPDYADLGFNVSLTWTAGSWIEDQKRQGDLFFAFLNSGGKEGVEKITVDVIQDRLRVWAFSGEEGPANWQEAMGAKDDAIAILIKAVLGDDIPGIPSAIPTSILLRYYNVPRKPPLEYQRRVWGKKTKNGSEWEGLEQELDKLKEQNKTSDLEKAIRERQEIIAKIKQGNGHFISNALGITLHRFTITNVQLKGEVANAVLRRPQEQQEREAEKTEMDHFMERVDELRGKGFSNELAAEITQITLGKVTKTVQEKKGSVSPDILKAFEKSLKEVLEKIFDKND